ncbi:dihydrolipoamide acetyltransferase family protein [Marinobacter halophilus]|uniref:Dihydrolipoamide acetyltransferase component of pyruvate dehydrogenase complex n=1 Tax=Marinobacter halophilus TaxID=1323740 RepID=A0A2T1KBK2_9GAMM|nr:dihydrolipoamide acetyltransferase family protein [Marinobacter halophilus]PSF07495.1 2-oxo acid dehydrogenase subunit E2 [Marinobacter halophilus]GGC80463.1 dihydrolipoamide acetyltransferase component of pyruvate dehydrogenase complex [Marinobacter halophilus]
MKNFKLPDLGEGLPEAEIVEWHIKVGDTVEVDELLVSVETAKAIVEVPSPQAGTIAKLYGAPGDIIHTGEPLLAFEGEGDDTGTVVGELKTAGDDKGAHQDQFIIGAAPSSKRARANRATPGVRAQAERLGVSLETIKGSGPGGLVTTDDVHKQASQQKQVGDAESLRGTRRTMAKAMALSHAQVVPVSIFEDADIGDWNKDTDTTMRLVQAIGKACEEVPALNCWFDGDNLGRQLLDDVHVGIAVDTPDGLFVPVLRDITHRSLKDLRQGLENLRDAVVTRKIPPREMQGATITLSNFGTMTGQYANPIVIPPQVAIVGAGRIRDKVVPHNGTATIRRILPLSLTFDHRAATGGEVSRFLGALINALQKTG